MSLLQGEELRVALAPDRAEALRVRHGIGRAGIVAEQTVTSEPVEGVPVWRPALDALARLLPEARGRAAAVRVVLADRFCRYLLVPWRENLRDDREVEVLARLRFKEVFGEAANRWTVRVAPSAYGAPYLACATDTELLRALAGSFEAQRLRLLSVRPLLVSAYNACFGARACSEPWFSVRSDDRFVLCRIEKRAWHSVRSEALGPDFAASLHLAIEREALALGIDAAQEPVAQFAPQRGQFALAEDGRLGSAALDVDFGPRQRRASAAGIALMVAGLAAAAFSAQQYHLVAEEVAVQGATMADLRSAVRRERRPIQTSSEQTREIQQQIRVANGIIDRMTVPWDALFEAIESAADQTVALLSIQPNVNAGQIRITGEAGSYDAILDYARRIGRSGLLHQVHLAEHSIKTQQPQQPIGFLLVARWSRAP